MESSAADEDGVMSLKVSTKRFQWSKRLVTFVAVLALLVQPMYALVASKVADALAATVSSQSELVAKIADTSVDTINLGGSFTVASQININRTLTLNGNGVTLSAASGWNGTGSNDSILAVTGGNPTINNLIVDGAAATNTQGVQVWQSAATLNDVTARNSQKAGIHVNASTVNATNITTSNNSRGKSFWGVASFGGILVSAGGTLNIGGLSTHTSEGNHIRRDSGTVNDSNNQYNTISALGVTRYTLKSAPTAPIIASPTEAQNVVAPAGEVTITWNAVAGAHSYLVAVDGGAPSPIIGGTTLTRTLAEGPHTVTVQSVAQSGLVGGISQVRNFTVTIPDTIPPTLSVTSPSDGSTVRTRVSSTVNVLKVNGTFTDESGGYVELQLVGHGHAPVITTHAPVVDGELAVFDTTGFPDGQYELLARGTDYLGNALPQQVINVTIDNTGPVISKVSPVDNARVGKLLNLEFDVTDPSGVQQVNIHLFQGNVSKKVIPLTHAGGDRWTATNANIADLTDGEYTFISRAVDNLGNLRADNTSTHGKIVIDNTSPTIHVKGQGNTHTPFSLGQGNVFREVSFKLFDSGKIDRVEINGVNKNLTDATWSDVNNVKPGVFGAIEGLNTIVAFDVAGNSTSYTFVLDTKAPKITVKTVAPEAYVGSLADNIFSKVSFALEDQGSASLNKLDKYSINGHVVPVTPNKWSDANFNNIKPRLVEGENVLVLYDQAGNSSSYTFIYDATKPTATFSYSNNNGNQLTKNDVTVTMTTNEPIQTPADWTRVSDTVFTRVYSANGKNYVTITDIAGNSSSALLHEVKRIDRNAPTISGANDGETVEGPVTLSIFDPKYEGYDGFDKNHGLTINGVKVSTTDGPAGTKTYLYTLTENGVYEVVATDKASNETRITFTIGSEAPVVDPSVVEIAGHVRNADGTYTITGTTTHSTDTVRLWFVADDETLEEIEGVVVDEEGNWSVTTSEVLAPGQYVLSATTTNEQGVETSVKKRYEFAVIAQGGGSTGTGTTGQQGSLETPILSTEEDDDDADTTDNTFIAFLPGTIGGIGINNGPATTPLPAVPATNNNNSDDTDVLGAEDTRADWSIVNAALAGFIAILSVVALAGIRRGQADNNTGARIFTLVPAAAAVIAFFVIEGVSGSMIWFNVWTWLFAGILVVQAIIATLTTKTAND